MSVVSHWCDMQAYDAANRASILSCIWKEVVGLKSYHLRPTTFAGHARRQTLGVRIEISTMAKLLRSDL